MFIAAMLIFSRDEEEGLRALTVMTDANFVTSDSSAKVS